MSYITYKGIEHERLGDAPFIGALIIAAQCSGVCKDCFNLELREDPNLFGTADGIIKQVQSNPLNEGIILGGLEWTEQPDDMLDLINTATWTYPKLRIMIYTRLTEEEFLNRFPQLAGRDVWCKFGKFRNDMWSDIHFSHGVKLASTNQYIKYLGGTQ